jgi:endonuclease YncB( thermonuclease family)
MNERGWQRAFDDPIPLPDGGKLITLHDAATYITKLPKREHDAPEWQAASGRPMKRALLVLVVLLAAPTGTLAADLTGQASVIDGDTLEIHGTRIRPWGIDAPESRQLCRDDDSLPYRCGANAANDLDAFIARRPVSCVPVTLDRYGRTVATCSVDGIDLADWLVRNGFALDWPRYSRGKYDPAQHEAEHAQRGMWAGGYVEPWLYRACVRQGGRPACGRCNCPPLRS